MEISGIDRVSPGPHAPDGRPARYLTGPESRGQAGESPGSGDGRSPTCGRTWPPNAWRSMTRRCATWTSSAADTGSRSDHGNPISPGSRAFDAAAGQRRTRGCHLPGRRRHRRVEPPRPCIGASSPFWGDLPGHAASNPGPAITSQNNPLTRPVTVRGCPVLCGLRAEGYGRAQAATANTRAKPRGVCGAVAPSPAWAPESSPRCSPRW